MGSWLSSAPLQDPGILEGKGARDPPGLPAGAAARWEALLGKVSAKATLATPSLCILGASRLRRIWEHPTGAIPRWGDTSVLGWQLMEMRVRR